MLLSNRKENMTDPKEKPQTESLGILHNANHVAYRCRDADQTRWFYEEVLGLPLAIALSLDEIPGLNEPTPYLHLFFEMGNGDFIAFFDEPEGATPEQFERDHSFNRHLAFEVDGEDKLLAWQKQINERGVSCLGPVDHGFVKSVYMYDPNGLQVEITTRTADYDKIVAHEHEHAEEHMKMWAKRTRQAKEAKFGATAIDVRSRQVGRRQT